MGNFSNNSITDVGKMLLADVQAGAVFVPTRIVIGSGSMSGGATTQGMTDVITPVKSLAINKKKRTPDGKCVFGGVYTNEEVTEPFYFRELALYAKAVYLNEDGSVKSEGAETLYSYGNAGSTADYMPAYSTSTVVEKQMDLITWVGNDAQVDLTIDSGIYVPHEEFDAHASRHVSGGEDPISPADIGAAYADITMLPESDIPTDWAEFWALNSGTYSWVQIERLAWEPEETPAGALRVVLDIKKSTGGSYSAQLRYIDGATKLGEYIGERYSDIGRWAKSYNSYYKPTPAEIGAAPAGYGLGGGAVWFDAKNIDNLKNNGWFYTSVANGYYIETVPIFYLHLKVDSWKDAAGESMVVQTLHHETHQIRRVCKNGVWGLWEWENPPMITGVEYRTTERYNNAAVFKKVDTNGNILWRTWGGSWHLLASASNVATATVE